MISVGSFQSMYIYSKDYKYPIGVVFFYGDNVYVDGRHYVRVGVSEALEREVFEVQETRYIDLFMLLKEIRSESIEETHFQKIKNIQKSINGVGDIFKVGQPLPYTYKYDKISKSIFKNVLKSNNMKDIGEI